MTEEFHFSKGVRQGCAALAILLGILLIPLPAAIWLWLKRSSGKLTFDAESCTVNGLGLFPLRIRFDEVQRMGRLNVRVPNAGIGGAIAKLLSGGDVAVNLCLRLESGKQVTFMASRFQQQQRIVEHLSAATGRPLERLERGFGGVKWPESDAARV